MRQLRNFLATLRHHRGIALPVLASMLIVTLGATSVILSQPDTPAAFSTNTTKNTLITVPITSISTVIHQENQLPGTSDWQISVNGAQFIQGYAGQVSVSAGDHVPLYISTATPTTYDIDVYRIGWYDGLGGRLVFAQHGLKSEAQGYWTKTAGLVQCRRCLIDTTTHLIDANWQESYMLAVDASWPTGSYLIKLSAGSKGQSYIPLVVRDDASHASILLSLPVNTYQAYNVWGGISLYQKAGVQAVGEDTSLRATKVSFNRPYDRSAGAGDFLSWDIHTIRWLERSGFDVAYTTNVDMAQNPQLTLNHRVFLSVGHDEYWTKSMRDGIEAARDHGVNLAFLGANDLYWQARYEPDSLGNLDRTLICYKVLTNSTDPTQALKDDPDYPAHNGEVTSLWRDPVVGRPENAVMGLMYLSYFNAITPNGFYLPDWIVPANTLDPLEVGTGLESGMHIKGGLLGYEYDGVVDNGLTPANLQLLAQSPVTNVYHVQQTANSAYYRAALGNYVFDAGSIWWGWGLDESSPTGAGQTNLLKGNQSIANLTANMLRAMLAVTPGKSPTPTTTATATPAH